MRTKPVRGSGSEAKSEPLYRSRLTEYILQVQLFR